MSSEPKPRPVAPPVAVDDEPTIVWSTPDWVEEAVDVETATRGYGDDESADATVPDVPSADGAPSQAVESVPRADVEVEIRKMTLEAARRMPRVYEIWTKNRVYSLDASLDCIEVIDLATGQPKPDHPFIGAKLAGGQCQTEKYHEMSFPLPAPGSDAVFQKRDRKNRVRLSLTSSVTRVILHIQRARVPNDNRDQAWGRITQT